MDKNPIKNQWSELSQEDKREGQRKAKRHTAQRNQRRERAKTLSRDRKLSHPQPL